MSGIVSGAGLVPVDGLGLDGQLSALGKVSLSDYIRKVNSFPILSESEERRLLEDFIMNGNTSSIHKVLESHLRLVVKMAMGFRKYRASIFDLIAEGNLGLMKAAKNFSLKKKVRFSTYAMLWVKASMQEFVLKTFSVVRIGTTSSQKRVMFGLAKVKRQLGIKTSEEYGRRIDQVARMLNVKKSDLLGVSTRMGMPDVSLESPTCGDGDKTLETIMPSGEESQEVSVMNKERELNLKSVVRDGMLALNDREKLVLEARRLAYFPKTLAVLASELGVSIERVRQIEANAVRKVGIRLSEKYGSEISV